MSEIRFTSVKSWNEIADEISKLMAGDGFIDPPSIGEPLHISMKKVLDYILFLKSKRSLE